MTVGQFKKFASMFTLHDAKIRFYDYSLKSYLFREELDIDNMDNYIVYSYTVFLDSNEIHVFIKDE